MVRLFGVLDRKVIRDLWALRTQAVTIALLIAAGVAIFVMSLSNYRTLLRSQASHYTSERFAEIFASLKRAPLLVAERLRELDGIGVLEVRIVATVRIDHPDSVLPITGRMVSVPRTGQPVLNRLVIVEGQWIDPHHRDEVLLNEAFARARSLRPGDRVRVILNGRLQNFRIAGLALSPEFVFASRAGEPLPDDRNFAVLWAGEDAVAAAFDMEGAFNDIVTTLAPGASETGAIAAIDTILAPWGGTGAFGRADHPSHRFVEDELAEQRTLALITPILFFGVAAFLLAVVVGRMVEAQREQVAALKALGYPTGPILRHYILLVGLIAFAGAVVGGIVGDFFARSVIEMYRPYFRFPKLDHHLEPWVSVVAIVVSFAVAVAAVTRAVRRIVLLPAAVAMRAPAPPRFSAVGWASIGSDLLPPRWRLVMRGLVGRWVRTLLSIAGVALAVPLVVLGLFWFDALDYMIDLSFGRIERSDAVVTLNAPVPARAVNEVHSLTGVVAAEGQRIVPVRLRLGHRTYRTGLTGLAADADLRTSRTRELARVAVPADGLLLSRRLAERLGARPGDVITVEVLDGARPVREAVLAAVADDVLGFTATMELSALTRLMREGPSVNAIALKLDSVVTDELWPRLAAMPHVEAASAKSVWLRMFEERVVGLIRVSALILTGFGMLIAVGVVYNIARVSLQERAWELASLRVLGFTRGEVAGILFAELAVVVVAGVPLGLWLAGLIARTLLAARSTESFDIPPVIELSTLVIAAAVVAGAGLASAWAVRRRVDALDLVAVLKTRD